jgi:hypothetical protein
MKNHSAAIALVLFELLSGSFNFLAYGWQRVAHTHPRAFGFTELLHLKAE